AAAGGAIVDGVCRSLVAAHEARRGRGRAGGGRRCGRDRRRRLGGVVGVILDGRRHDRCANHEGRRHHGRAADAVRQLLHFRFSVQGRSAHPYTLMPRPVPRTMHGAAAPMMPPGAGRAQGGERPARSSWPLRGARGVVEAESASTGGGRVAGLFLLFVVVPLLELAILIKVGSVVGVWPTIGMLVATAALGSWLARTQGARVLGAIRADLSVGRMPAAHLLDGLMILAGGLMLLA